MKIKIYFDGGCKPNPGMMEACVVIHGEGPPEAHTWFDIGQGTNNIAEWTALVWAAGIAKERGYTDVEFIGDNIMVVKQAANEWKIKERGFRPFKEEFVKHNFTVKGSLRQVPRAENAAGNYLENGVL